MQKTPSDTQDDMSSDSDFDLSASKDYISKRRACTSRDSIDYWFGNIYLKTVLAQKLLTQPDMEATFPELDVCCY